MPMMFDALSTKERVDIITRGQNFTNDSSREAIETLLQSKKKPKIFWSTVLAGEPHIGYLVPLAKIADFLHAGLDVTILYADVYGLIADYLHPSPLELIAQRKRYYHSLIMATLELFGVNTSLINFVGESSYAYTMSFRSDFQRCCDLMSQNETLGAVEMQATSKRLAPLLCCVHQYLAKVYLDADIRLGGEDQLTIFQHAQSILPSLKEPTIYLINPTVPSLAPTPPHTSTPPKMSSTAPPSSKISFLDSPRQVTEKILSIPITESHTHGGYSTNNALLNILRTIILPLSKLRNERRLSYSNTHSPSSFPLNKSPSPDSRSCACTYPHTPPPEVEQPKHSISDAFAPDAFTSADAPEGSIFTVEVAIWCFGETVRKHYSSFEELESDWKCARMGEEDLKIAVARSLNCVLEPIRRRLEGGEVWEGAEEEG